MTQQNYSLIDKLIIQVDENLRAITGALTHSNRETPAAHIKETKLTAPEKKHSASLMRVNHSGEVCAQALYLGQSMVATSPTIKKELQTCAEEEVDHLYWCQMRVNELHSHVSYLNPFWFSSSFMIGVLAGLGGDKWNLGFLAQTEYQVGEHLKKHLQQLPSNDKKSHKIVAQMHRDELQHAKTAEKNGAAELPSPVKTLMQWVSKVMTTTTYYV